MTDLLHSKISEWLQADATNEPSIYKIHFAEHHLGNIWIRSLHGGVTGAFIELAAEAETRNLIDKNADLMIVSNSIDYLRVTKDADLFARTTIVRQSRRLCVADVLCWQDSEDAPVARGVVAIKINHGNKT